MLFYLKLNWVETHTGIVNYVENNCFLLNSCDDFMGPLNKTCI